MPVLRVALLARINLNDSLEVFNIVCNHQDQFGEASERFMEDFIGHLTKIAEYDPDKVATILAKMPESAQKEYSDYLEREIKKGRERQARISGR